MDIQELMKQLGEGGIHVDGDFVMNKTITHNVEKVAPGGIAFYVAGGSTWAGDSSADTPVVRDLLPLFQGNRAEVMAFLSCIDGAKPTAVTEKVNELVAAGKILRANRKHEMWAVLNRHGLYKPSEPNWCAQVN